MGTDLGWENKLSLRTAEPQPNGGEVGKGEIYTTKYTKYTKKDTFFDPKCPAAFATMMPVRPGLSPFPFPGSRISRISRISWLKSGLRSVFYS